MKSPIPAKGSVEIRVCGWGHMPGNVSMVDAYVNNQGPFEFTRAPDERWKFQSYILNSEEQKMLNDVWVGQMNRSKVE